MRTFINQTFTGCSIFASLLLSLSLTGCQDEDFGYTAEQIAYQSNFEKKFGKITDDQIWDFTSYNLYQLGLKGGPSNDDAAIGGMKTRAFDGNANDVRTTIDAWYNVEQSTINWLNGNMKERYDHRNEGSAFKLINPYYDENNSSEDRDFIIIPIYQGSSGMTWDLHLIDDQHDYNIWSKSKNIEYKVDFKQWEEFFYQGGETNSEWNADPDKAIPATKIKLVDAFDNRLKHGTDEINEYIYLGIELPEYEAHIPNSATGSLKGALYVYEDISEFKSTSPKKALVIDNINLSGRGRTNSSSDFTAGSDHVVYLGGLKHDQNGDKKYISSDGTEITLDENFSNLVFETTEMVNCSFDPYDPQRVRFFVKVTENQSADWLTDAQYTQLVDFEGTGDDKKSVSYFKGHTINRNNVRTKAMRINSKKIGPEFSLYLQTTFSDDNNANYAKLGTKHSSNGNPSMMLALQQFATNNSPLTQTQVEDALSTLGLNYTNCEYMVIGCEDANGSASDWDYNDVVFLFVGLPKVPKIAKNVISKRYMIEDLGSTFDFDFNDIVVDVTQEDVLDIATNLYSRKQITSIAHLCGTIPFEVFLGNVSPFGKLMGQNNNDSEDGYNPKTDPDYKTKYVKTYTSSKTWSPGSSVPDFGTDFPWNPTNNNITVSVWPQAASVVGATGSGSSSVQNSLNQLDIKDAQRIEFPARGKFPYIIAVDQDINWMKELTSVPRSWFYTTQNIEDYDHDIDHEKPTDPSDLLTDYMCEQLGLGYLIPTTKINNNASTGFTEITLDDVFTVNKYRQGIITISVVVSNNCADYTEVKGTFVQTSGGDLPDAYVDLEDFDQITRNGVTCKIKSVKLTSDEMMAAAEDGKLRFNVSYATYGFGSEWSPRARVLVQWDPAVPIGIVSTHWTVKTEEYGSLKDYSYSTDDNAGGRQQIVVGNWFDESYTSDQNAYITFVLPANYKLSGNFYAFDNKGFFYSTDVEMEGGPRAYTIKLGEEYKKMLGGQFGNWKGQFRFIVGSATKNGSTVSVGSEDVQIYVDWDANYLKLNNKADNNISLNVNGEAKTVTLNSSSAATVAATDYDSNIIDVSVDAQTITITPKAIGTTTITAYQPSLYDWKESNRVKINIEVKNMIAPAAGIDLNESQFHRWSAATTGGSIENMNPNGCAYNIGTSTDLVYGNSNVNILDYADLSSAKYLVVTATDGAPRFLFNRDENEGKAPDHMIDIPGNQTQTNIYQTVIENPEGSKTYIIDLDKIKDDKGYVHLHAIKSVNWGSETTVTSMKIDAYDCTSESGKTRTLWESAEGISADGWNTGGGDAVFATSIINSADTYRNTKLRVSVEGSNVSLQLSSGGILPADGINQWGNHTNVVDGHIDINIDNVYFQKMKQTGQFHINGDNVKVTKIELIPSNEIDYSLILDTPTQNFNFSNNYSSSRPIIAICENAGNNGFGWNNIESTQLSSHNTVVFELGTIKKADGSDFGTDETKPNVWITAHGSGYQGREKTVIDGKIIKLKYDGYQDQITDLYIATDMQCQIQVLRAYLTTE